MSVLDLFFPTGVKCIFCGEETTSFGICSACYGSLPFIKGKTCSRCGGNLHGQGSICYECAGRELLFEKCYCILEYLGDVQSKIISFKQASKKFIGFAFAELVHKKYIEIGEDVDVIIPVPVSDVRRKERGFNQSEVLCSELEETGKVDKHLLVRIKDTPHQTGLGRENRESNLKDAFKVLDKSKVKDRTILLVDDIYTTGSTLNACSETLLSAGAGRVLALCLARTPVDLERILK